MTLGRLMNGKRRLPRGRFWLYAAVVWMLLYLCWNVLGDDVTAAVVWLVNGTALFVLTVLCVRRLHDRNLSGWWLLVAVIPVAGALWLIWQIACRRGLPQGNRWGADPLGERGDYLVVQ